MSWPSRSSMPLLVCGFCHFLGAGLANHAAELLESNAIAWPNPSMWCSVLNPVMPVPTYHQDDGPSSHTHSPGRKSLLLRNIKPQSFPALNMAAAGFQNEAATGILGDPTLQLPYLGDNNLASGEMPSYSDPFTDSAYLEWASSLMHGETADAWDGMALWPANTRNQRQSNSDTIMPDYVPLRKPDAMHMSGPSLDDEPTSLKVPTNTPTGGSTDGGNNTHFQFQMPQHAALPSDFASSLTRSLLNQPFPLPTHHHNSSFSLTEPKATKDTQHGVLGQVNAALMQSVARGDSIGARKVSQQPMFICDTNATSTAPVSAPSNSSCSEIGSILASFGSGHSGSLGTPGSFGQRESSAVSSGGKSSGSINAVMKRTRNFTPASVRAIDEEDEPRRVSPHLRTAGFDVVDILGDVTVGQ